MANLWGWGLLGLAGYDIYNRYNAAKKESQILLENQKKKERIMKLFDEYNLKLERWKNNSFIDVYDELEFYFYILEFAESNLKQSETKTVSLESRLLLFNENADNYLFSQQEKTKWEEIRDEIKFRIDKIISTYGEKLIEKQKIEKILCSLNKLKNKNIILKNEVDNIINLISNLSFKSKENICKNKYVFDELSKKELKNSKKLDVLILWEVCMTFLLLFLFGLLYGIGTSICNNYTDKMFFCNNLSVGINLKISAWVFLSIWIVLTIYTITYSLCYKVKKKKIFDLIDDYLKDFLVLKEEIMEIKRINENSYYNPDLNFNQENQDICYLDLNQKENKFEGNDIIIDNFHVKLDWNNSKYSISNRNVSYVIDKFSKYYEQYESDINEKKKENNQPMKITQ